MYFRCQNNDFLGTPGTSKIELNTVNSVFCLYFSILVPGCENGRFWGVGANQGKGTSDSGEPRARLRKIFWYQDTGYPVHRCVCMSVCMCIYVSRGVPECILGIKIVTLGVALGPLK